MDKPKEQPSAGSLVVLKKLYQKGTITSKDVHEGAVQFKKAGDKHKSIKKLSTAGSSGERRGNLYRGVMREMLCDSAEPLPYATSVKLWDPDEQKQIIEDMIS